MHSTPAPDVIGIAKRQVAPFRPAWWCRGPHCQTLWPHIARPRPRIKLRRERWELPDGDFIDVDWRDDARDIAGDDAGIVLLLHGLEGSSRSGYARGLLKAVRMHNWHGAIMHFRGCSGEPNRLARSYHSGETADLRYAISELRRRFPARKLAVVGYSLGGNVLLKYLGESKNDANIDAAVAVSVPFDLAKASARLNRGASRLYQWKLLNSLRRSARRKFARIEADFIMPELSRLNCFREFDHTVTAPLHGFSSAEDYYTQSSSRQYLPAIVTPTLILQARDDPFMTPDAMPLASEASTSTRLEIYGNGGHVGFVGGRWPWAAEYWLEARIPAFLAEFIA